MLKILNFNGRMKITRTQRLTTIGFIIWVIIMLALWTRPEYSFTVTKTGESRIDTIRSRKKTYNYIFKTKEFKNTEFVFESYSSDSLMKILQNGDKIFVQAVVDPKEILNRKILYIHTIKTKNICLENSGFEYKMIMTIGFTILILMFVVNFIFRPW